MGSHQIGKPFINSVNMSRILCGLISDNWLFHALGQIHTMHAKQTVQHIAFQKGISPVDRLPGD
ncbi:hypothetical protein SDC9_158134 [bioreactor metagenome]|uniref:Uncharacterized protein n=1 Tax=bioreactor metagenome TaxID=1076179 RepID=A0A645F9C4_9ZZZZ